MYTIFEEHSVRTCYNEQHEFQWPCEVSGFLRREISRYRCVYGKNMSVPHGYSFNEPFLTIDLYDKSHNLMDTIKYTVFI